MRTFYSEYVQHCMRFFARHSSPRFKSDADKQNWFACEGAIKCFSEKERGLIMEIYSGGDTIPDNIYRLAKERGISQDTIWKMINNLERRVAKRRGLI